MNGYVGLHWEDGERAFGEPLEGLLGSPMDPGRFLPLAIGISAAVGQVHRHGLVHKDIKPANILVDQATGAVRLTGIGIPSGTLAYIAPEQTGRMNRSVDSRSDLYSLGVTLYQMLTGSLPFSASDAMELVHSHVARTPVPPAERLQTVPTPVSALVMKLLAKTAEQRYQTAAGVESDLRRCLVAWEAHGRIDDFPLGEHDIRSRLLIPQKLYGRARETETLFAAFDRVATGGRPQLLLVSGYSGIGKSAVVRELQKMLVPSRGLFASGKFDQYKRDVPYATLAQAFQSLVRSLLSKSDTALERWRHDLLKALGANGRLMADLVPELTLIIGEQPLVPELPPQLAQGRFQLVFRSFIGVFARPERPLVVFFDDLQWVDAATIDLLEYLLIRSDVQHLMLIGAYRDNEPDVSHALMRKLAAIKSAGANIDEITLAPLAAEHLEQLIADALRCKPTDIAPLAQLVHAKTGGNPFFAIQFLTALADEGLLIFDHGQARWSWDLQRIHAKGYTDNVAELMVGKLQRLPAGTRNALKELSCLGNTTPVPTWNIIHGGSEETSNAALQEAVQAGLVVRSDADYVFLHDRVREAAYSLIGPEERAAMHLRIGRLLMAGCAAKDITEHVFDVVNHFNHALTLITEGSERNTVYGLNVVAGRRARAATAYASARHYLHEAAGLLPEDAWHDYYDETFALSLDLAECEYLIGNFARADVLFGLMLNRARSAVDRAKVHELQMQVYQVSGRPQDALAAALQGLALFGMTFPESDAEIGFAAEQEFARIRLNLSDRRVDDLLEAPVSSSADLRIIGSLLGGALAPVYIARPELWPLMVAKGVNLFLRCGNTEDSCLAYASYGSLLVARFGRIAEGFAMSSMAVQLNEKLQTTRLRGRLLLAYGACVHVWNRPFGTSVGILQQALEACTQVGDLAHAGYCPLSITGLMLERGDPLDVVVDAITGFASLAERSHNKALQVTMLLLRRALDELRGVPQSAADNAGNFDEHAALDFLDNTSYHVGIAEYEAGKLLSAFMLGRSAEALALAADADAGRSRLLIIICELTSTFLQALTLTALLPEATIPARTQYRQVIDRHWQQLQLWAQNCPENFEDRAELLSAEIARIEGRALDAEEHYERAIRLAHANGFIHIEALAHELAGRFYLHRAMETSAYAHLSEAVACFRQWGAKAKASQLEQLYPRLQRWAALAGPPVRQLDVATVIKASQALSREILPQKLIESLMTVALENAGASRGLLAEPLGDSYRIVAEAVTSGEKVAVRLCDLPMAAPDCPEAVLRYVIRTRQSLILDDATEPNAVWDEAYQRDRQPRSILCLPLAREGRLPGLLYLENTLTSHVFTPDRVALLELLAGQAAISLENTRLYDDLQARERRFRQLVDSNMIGIIFWEVDGGIRDANDAVLSLLGYSRQELLARKMDWREMTPPEYRDADAHALEQIQQTGTCTPYEKEWIGSDGRRIPILIGGAFQEGSRVDGVAFVLDLSERRRAEADRQARQMAEAASQAKSEFLATMSHELRTPLNGILGYAQMLRRDPSLNERQLAAVQVMHHSGEQLLTLINDVLDLAKIEARRFELHIAELSLVEFLRDLVALISVSARQKGLRFETDWGPDLPARVRADQQRLRRVLLNLLSNGVKFTDRGCVSLRVRFRPPERLLFVVRDTGIGIREDQLDRIFEPFGQVADPSRREGGTGLGLSISRRLVASMGGELRAKSRMGKGSTFWFELVTPVLDNEEQQTVIVPAAVTGYEGSQRRILIADDVDSSRAVLSDWLRPLGFELAEALDGADAVEKAAAWRPDLILMDLAMPRMDGLDAIRSLRRAGEPREVPIIAISASAAEQEAARSLGAGADAFLAKPINFERLEVKLGELLGITWTYAPTPHPGEEPGPQEALVSPPDSEIEILYELAQQGCMSDIYRRAERLVSLGERYWPFARELQRLAKAYQSQAILRLVEQHRQSTRPADSIS